MKTLAKIALSSMFVLGITACIGNTTNHIASGDEGNFQASSASIQDTLKHLEFVNMNVFDKRLSAAMMNKHYEIQVSMLSPFSTNDVPKKLDAWLTMVSDFGGEVNIEPVNNEGSRAFGVLVPLTLALVSKYENYKNQKKYNAAQNYNATVLYEHNEQGVAIVKKVVFSHKQKPVNMKEQESGIEN